MKRLLILIMTFVLLISACSKHNKAKAETKSQEKSPEENFDPKKPISWGKEQIIYIFADPAVWKSVEPYVKTTLERPFYTVKNEKLFEVRLGDVNKLDQFYKYKNLLFFCDLSTDQPVAKYVKAIMNKTMKDYVAKHSAGMFAKHNLWANEQFVVFMIGNNHETLNMYNIKNSNELFYHFKMKLISRTAYKMRQQKKVPLKEFKAYPFTLSIPETYLIYKRYPEKRFLSYMWRSREDQQQNPDKYISVYYEKSDKNIVDKEWIEKTRKKIAWDYYDQDEMQKEDVQFGRYRFLDRITWYMSGRWQNKKYFIGGTFQSMAFYDEKTKTAYLIDTSVYFPYGDKLKYIIELESIAKTFKTK